MTHTYVAYSIRLELLMLEAGGEPVGMLVAYRGEVA